MRVLLAMADELTAVLLAPSLNTFDFRPMIRKFKELPFWRVC